MDSLRRKGILEASAPPSYGHETRREAALLHLRKSFLYELRENCEELVFRLADEVRDTSQRTIPYASCLLDLGALAGEIELSAEACAACEISNSLVSGDVSRLKLPASVVQLLRTRIKRPGFLAMGIVNAGIAAKERRDLAERDALVEELRRLHADYAEDAAVRERLARGLFNTLVHAKEENDLVRRDALLEELRRVHAKYPDDAIVREGLAKGLLNTLVDAKEANDLARRDALLEELRRLHAEYPDDAAVREQLAKGLLNTLNHAKQENDLARRDALLQELRELARRYSGDGWVGKLREMGLQI